MGIKLNSKRNKKVRNPNWLLRFTILVISVPTIILGWVIISSLQSSNEPVVGSRFDKQLNPAITEAQIKQIQDTLKYDAVDSITVNLKSATLRINADIANDAPEEHITNVMNDIYNKVNEVLPIETYFTSKEGNKMYDIEIHSYNFIPTDENRPAFIYHILTKNANSSEVKHTNPSRPVNEAEANILKNLKIPEEGGQ